MKTQNFMRPAKRNLRLVIFESAITASLICMPIMTLFYQEKIGLSFAEIGLTQAIFSCIMIVLDLPMGYIADRFGRKQCNYIGDFGVGLTLLYYATVTNFWQVVLAECLLAIFGSLSDGVDASLLRHFSDKIDDSGRLFRRKWSQLSAWQNFANAALLLSGIPLMLLGEAFGFDAYRFLIAAAALPAFIGGVVSLVIKDDSERLSKVYRNPIQDIIRIVAECIKNRRLRLAIMAAIVSREMTHTMIWLTVPVMVMVGLPTGVIALPYILTAIPSNFCTDWHIPCGKVAEYC